MREEEYPQRLKEYGVIILNALVERVAEVNLSRRLDPRQLVNRTGCRRPTSEGMPPPGESILLVVFLILAVVLLLVAMFCYRWPCSVG